MTIPVMSSASWLAGDVLSAPNVRNELVVVAGFILFSAANGYRQGALAGRRRENVLQVQRDNV